MLERICRFRNGSLAVLRFAPAAQDDRIETVVDMQESEVHQYFVYMMTNKNKTALYTGVTNSLNRRVWEHKHKFVPGFTKKYNCDRLIFFEVYERIEQAIAREKQIKGWTRAKKNALVFRRTRDGKTSRRRGTTINATGPSPSSRLRMTEGTQNDRRSQ